MVTRVFEQEWEQCASTLNGRIEKNVLFDFFDYLSKMERDLKALKKDYEKEFNKFSKRPLNHYINLFEKRKEQYFSILIKNHKFTRGVGRLQSYEGYNPGIVLKNGNHHKIADKYYKVLSKIANSIFEIEDQIAPVVEIMWENAITDISNYDKNNEYFLLAHVDRKDMPEENFSEEFNKYNKLQEGLCFSAISNKKTRLYNDSSYSCGYYSHPNGAVGIIAKPKKDAIVGISLDDMLSTEYINEKCAFKKHFQHSKVNRCFYNQTNEICCNGTKICPPKEIFNFDVDTINEIILDSKKIEVMAVFYVKTKRGDIPTRLNAYKLQQEKLCGHTLPVIELLPRNKLSQINLDELYECGM